MYCRRGRFCRGFAVSFRFVLFSLVLVPQHPPPLHTPTSPLTSASSLPSAACRPACQTTSSTCIPPPSPPYKYRPRPSPRRLLSSAPACQTLSSTCLPPHTQIHRPLPSPQLPPSLSDHVFYLPPPSHKYTGLFPPLRRLPPSLSDPVFYLPPPSHTNTPASSLPSAGCHPACQTMSSTCLHPHTQIHRPLPSPPQAAAQPFRPCILHASPLTQKYTGLFPPLHRLPPSLSDHVFYLPPPSHKYTGLFPPLRRLPPSLSDHVFYLPRHSVDSLQTQQQQQQQQAQQQAQAQKQRHSMDGPPPPLCSRSMSEGGRGQVRAHGCHRAGSREGTLQCLVGGVRVEGLGLCVSDIVQGLGARVQGLHTRGQALGPGTRA